MPGREITFAWIDETKKLPSELKVNLQEPLINIHKASEDAATFTKSWISNVASIGWGIPITKENFYLSTKVDFREIEADLQALPRPDHISFKRKLFKGTEKSYNRLLRDRRFKVIELQKYTKKEVICLLEDESKVSSMYWFTQNSIIRYSDHWGVCRDCFWTLNDEEPIEEGTFRFGVAQNTEFRILDLDKFLIGLFNINI